MEDKPNYSPTLQQYTTLNQMKRQETYRAAKRVISSIKTNRNM